MPAWSPTRPFSTGRLRGKKVKAMFARVLYGSIAVVSGWSCSIRNPRFHDLLWPEAKHNMSLGRSTSNEMKSLVLITAIALLLSACKGTGLTYTVATESMAPTLKIGDVVFADPIAYKIATPQRGDIVVVRSEEHTSELQSLA